MILNQNALGQEPFAWQLGEEDGLPSMTTYRIIQDQKGFIWIGTENGLCRYDGKKFENFSNDRLIDNEILLLNEDKLGRIWFANLAGQIAFIDQGNLQIFNTEEDKGISEFLLDGKFLWTLFKRNSETKERDLIKYEFDAKGKLIGKTQIQISGNNLRGNIEKHNGEILIMGGKNRIGKIFKVNIFSNTVEDSKIIITEGDFWNKMNYLFSLNKDRLALIPNGLNFLENNNGVWNLKKDKNTSIQIKKLGSDKNWISTNEGFFHIDDISSFYKNRSMAELDVNDVFCDKENNLWIATNGQGVFVIPSIKSDYYSVANSNLPSNKIFILKGDENFPLMLGLDKGIINFPNTNKSFKLNTNNRITSIFKDNYNTYWASAEDRLLVFQNETDKVKELQVTSGVKCIGQDFDDRFLIGTSLRLLKADRVTDFEGLNNSIPLVWNNKLEKRTYDIFSSKEKKNWIGTSNGIYQFQNNQVIPFLENGIHQSYSISSITESKDSTIWVATLSNGVLGIKNDSVVYRLNENSGLSSDNCKTLYYDEYNNLWIGTKNGLNKLSLDDFEIDIINKFDGLPTDEIYSVYAADSTVWIGTMKGLVSIPFKEIKKNKISPPIYLTNIKIWEKDTILLDQYNLKYDQNNLNIEFVGLTYRNRGSTDYQYRMIGVDTNWVSTQTRFARFPQLSAGEYEFQVKAINEDGIESIQSASIKFNIAQPWWETWWFYGLVLLGVIGGTSFVFYNRFQRIQKEEKRKQEFSERINELKSMALQAQMNPHFVFNALNAIQKFLTTNEQEEAMIYLARFAQLIRTIFEQSKEKEITLDEEIEFLKLYLDLEKLRFKDKIDVQFIIDESITDMDYDIKMPPLLIQPIVENAFKHGLMHKEVGGVLKVVFSKNKNVLYCVIKDNGVGRENAELMGEGKIKNQNPSGIATTKERLRIFNSPLEKLNHQDDFVIEDLFDGNGSPNGTKVQIKIRHT